MKFADYDSAEVLAVNGKYGLVNYKGKQCWVLLTEGNASGDLNGLPFRDAPPLPIVKISVNNNLGKYVYLIFYNWDTGERVKTLALNAGQSVTVKLPSGYYSLKGYNKSNQLMYDPMQVLNLAVGDGNHIWGLSDGTAWISLEP